MKDLESAGHELVMVSHENGRSPLVDTSCPDAEVFSDLYDRVFVDLWNFVRRRSNQGSDADDVVSEVFSIAWRRREKLPPFDERRLWLFGVARNVLLNQRRSNIRRERLTGRLAICHQPAISCDVVERDDSIWKALAELSEDDRDVLLMRAWDQLSVTEIAVLLECSPNAVSIRLHRAKARLRNELALIDLAQKDFDVSGNEVFEPAVLETHNE